MKSSFKAIAFLAVWILVMVALAVWPVEQPTPAFTVHYSSADGSPGWIADACESDGVAWQARTDGMCYAEDRP